MPYGEEKVYSDGAHFVAIPHSTNPTRRRKKPPEEEMQNTKSAAMKIRICDTTSLQLTLMQNKRPKRHHTNATIN